MVAPTLAATALHCLVNRALGRVMPSHSIHLLLGYHDGAFTRHLIPTDIIIAPGADATARRPRATDLALLRVATPVTAILPPSSAPAPPGTTLSLAGFAQDRVERMTVDPDCAAQGYARDQDGKPLLVHTCSGTRGASGGPILSRGPDGEWQLVGLEVAGNKEGAGGLAVPGFTIQSLLAAHR